MNKKTILVDAWNTFVTHNGINKELLSILDSFQNQKIIVTNANDSERIKFGIINMPYPVFSLSHNPNKTSPEYFEKLFKVYNLSANNVVYFEHNKDAIKSALSVGICSFWYNHEKPNIEELVTFLKSNL